MLVAEKKAAPGNTRSGLSMEHSTIGREKKENIFNYVRILNIYYINGHIRDYTSYKSCNVCTNE